MALPTNRSTSSTAAEHVADHNTLHTQHNEVEGHVADTTSVHGIADTSVLATDAEVTAAVDAHVAAADPHVAYQKESEKGAANGYAPLNVDAQVAPDYLGGPGGTAGTYLDGSGNWSDPVAAHLADATPHTGFVTLDGGGDTITANDTEPTAPTTNDVWHRAPTFVRRTTDSTAKNNNTVRAADDVLQLALEGGCIYIVRARLAVTTPDAADFSYKFTCAGATMEWTPACPGNVSGTGTTGSTKWGVLTIADAVTATIGSAEVSWISEGLLIMGASDATLSLDWAQATGTVGDTTLNAGSYLHALKVG